MTPAKRWNGWWRFAQAAVSSLSMPPADVARSDDQVERLLTGNTLFAAARAMAATLFTAWTNSATSRLVGPIAARLEPLPAPDRMRAAGWAAVVAALTVIAVRVFNPLRPHWLELVLPGAVAVAGLLVAAAAEPLTRARADSKR